MYSTDDEHTKRISTDLSSIMSGSIKLGTMDSRTSTFRPIPTSYSDTLELFPDPDSEAPEQSRHRNCCCTCTCRRTVHHSTDTHRLVENQALEAEQSENRSQNTTIYDKWVEWSGDTSMHGVKYIFQGNKISKTLFLLFMIGFVVKLAWQLSESIESYRSYPTTSKIQIADVEGPPSVTFPTISVCSHNMVSKSYLDSNPGLEDVWSILDTWSVEETKNINFSDPVIARFSNMTYYEVLMNGGPKKSTFLRCEHFIDHCFQHEVFGENYVVMEVTNTGKCFRINPEGKLRGKGGDYGKLTLKFFADLNEYSSSGQKLPQVGYAVQFHDHEQFSSSLPSSFWMSPGLIYKVDLSLLREFRLGPPAGTCNDTVLYNTYGRHEENSCLAQCRDDSLVAKCGCVLVPPPLPQNNPSVNYRSCTLAEWATCGLPTYINWYSNYVDHAREENICHCFPACREVFYKASLSSSILSKFYAKNHVDMLPQGYGTVDDVTDNLVVIDILFTSTQETEITELVSYGWGNFLGDVGGVLGLFLGASAFTLIEFVFFIAALIWSAIVGLFKSS
ncbi:hypothetical protein ACHWQZ_G016054 [Mnemiopsis leidyi]